MTDLADIDAELPLEPSKAAQYLLYSIAALIFIGLLWAAVAKLDRVTRGDGRVVPSSRLQKVQYLEGGIVKEILVKAGDSVKEGDILVRLDPTQANAKFAQGRDGYNLLAARIARLEAEATGAALDFPAALSSAAPKIIADETALHEARFKEFKDALAVEEARLSEAESAYEIASEAFSFASQELSMISPLVEKGIEPRIELVRARQRYSTARGEKQRAEILVRSATSEVNRIKSSFFAQAADELGKVKSEMAGISGELPTLQDKFERTEARAPIDGIVNRVLVTTLGGVVQPGETLVEIVPNGEAPLVEAKVKPSDIGFLKIGQAARVKITAYDSAVYGALEGVIETISPDAIEDPTNGERHFLITVRLADEKAAPGKTSLPILSGMAAEVDILNGKRTVLAYILKPLADVKSRALQEQ